MSARREELLERAYGYALEHGLASLSLRPLAEAVGSSPRVLLFLFGSKDGLVRALLERARADELQFLASAPAGDASAPAGDGASGPAGASAYPPAGELAAVGARVWEWLAAPERRGLLTLWVEAYARSLVEPHGPWSGFAARTVDDWLDVLAAAQPATRRRTSAGAAERTAVLAVLRGAMLDVLATGDVTRTTAAVHSQLRSVGRGQSVGNPNG